MLSRLPVVQANSFHRIVPQARLIEKGQTARRALPRNRRATYTAMPRANFRSEVPTSDIRPMPPEPIISVSGLRGIVGESLTPDVAIRYVCAFAAELPPGPIVITRDGRTTGPMLATCLTGGLTAIGRTVVNGGIAATPTTGVLVRSYRAAGGVQISASHNPAEYNGLKLFSAEGRVIPADAGERVIERYRGSSPRLV